MAPRPESKHGKHHQPRDKHQPRSKQQPRAKRLPRDRASAPSSQLAERNWDRALADDSALAAFFATEQGQHLRPATVQWLIWVATTQGLDLDENDFARVAAIVETNDSALAAFLASEQGQRLSPRTVRSLRSLTKTCGLDLSTEQLARAAAVIEHG